MSLTGNESFFFSSSIYKEFMDGNKEINPGNVAPLFSQEEQKKLANLDAVNSVIRVINIVDKIKIQNFHVCKHIRINYYVGFAFYLLDFFNC